jgi:hypothetical protein
MGLISVRGTMENWWLSLFPFRGDFGNKAAKRSIG